MAKKPSITTVRSGYLSNEQLTENFTNIQEAFENTVSRDGSAPNSMSSDLDVNGNRVINHADPVNDSDLVTKGYADEAYGNSATIQALAQQVEDDAAQVASDKATVESITNAVPSAVENFTGDGIETVYTVSAFTIEDSLSLLVVTSDGLLQDGTDYSVSGQDVTFVTAPNGAFEIRYIGTSVQADIEADAFKTIAVAGQTDVVAVGEDELTLVAGNDIQISTDAVSKNVTIASTASAPENLNDLSDVSVGGAVNDDFLRYNGVSWVNEAVGLGDLTGDTSDITQAANFNYVTDAEKTILSNTSGTNSGDQTITLTGAVTGVSTGTGASTSISTSITDGAIGFAKLESLQGASLLGRSEPASGAPEEIELGSTMIMNGNVLDVNPAAGVGDVVGPASATDNAIPRFDGITGSFIQNSGVTIDDSDNISGANMSLVGAANTVTIDDTNLKVAQTTDLQTYLELNDTALLNARSTGVRFGGILSDQGAGVVRITAGAGQILDNTDSENPTYIAVTWSQTDLDLSAADGVYYIYVNSSGTVTSQTATPDRGEYRTKIFLQRVSIRSGVVSGFFTIASSVQQDTAQIGDLYDALGTIKAGQELNPNGVGLGFATSAGAFYGKGINYNNSYIDPNGLPISAENPVTFRHVVRDGTQGSDITAIDVGNYDAAGVITAISGAGSRSTLFPVYRFPSGNTRVFYGQTIYNTLGEAVASVNEYFGDLVVPESYRTGAVLLGFIAARKDATDLTDPAQGRFISTNKFGGIGGGIVSSGSTVSGPLSSTDSAIALFDGTSGQALKNSAVTVDGSGNIVTSGTLNTGQGANELYAMDQDVQTTDDVSFNSLSLTTDLSITEGGTGASTAADARTNLGLGALATLDTVGTTEINDDSVTLAKQASGTANTLQGFDATGNPSEITAGTALTVSSGSLDLDDTAVTAGSYTSANITVDAQGRITAAANGSGGGGGGGLAQYEYKTSGAASQTSTSTTWVDATDMTFTKTVTSGNAVEVEFGFAFGGLNSIQAGIRILRGATVLFQDDNAVQAVSGMSNLLTFQSFKVVDDAHGGGSHTWKLQFRRTSGGSSTGTVQILSSSTNQRLAVFKEFG